MALDATARSYGYGGWRHYRDVVARMTGTPWIRRRRHASRLTRQLQDLAEAAREADLPPGAELTWLIRDGVARAPFASGSIATPTRLLAHLSGRVADVHPKAEGLHEKVIAITGWRALGAPLAAGHEHMLLVSIEVDAVGGTASSVVMRQDGNLLWESHHDGRTCTHHLWALGSGPMGGDPVTAAGRMTGRTGSAPCGTVAFDPTAWGFHPTAVITEDHGECVVMTPMEDAT